MKKLLLTGCLLAAAAAGSAEAANGSASKEATTAKKNAISVHVLNTQTGQPAEGVKVILERLDDGQWQQIADASTSASGRISALYPAGKPVKQGVYQARFETADWYKSHNGKTFFPEIPIQFQIEDTRQHYHIPLLLSPYGYTTYRGS